MKKNYFKFKMIKIILNQLKILNTKHIIKILSLTFVKSVKRKLNGQCPSLD